MNNPITDLEICAKEISDINKIVRSPVGDLSGAIIKIARILASHNTLLTELVKAQPPHITQVRVTSLSDVKGIISDVASISGKKILHIVVGDANWSPSAEELREIADLFSSALQDPLGSIVVTRPGISASIVDAEKPSVD